MRWVLYILLSVAVAAGLVQSALLTFRTYVILLVDGGSSADLARATAIMTFCLLVTAALFMGMKGMRPQRTRTVLVHEQARALPTPPRDEYLRTRAAMLQRELTEAQAELSRLRAELDAQPVMDGKVDLAAFRRSFAKRFHPEGRMGNLDPEIRELVFKEMNELLQEARSEIRTGD